MTARRQRLCEVWEHAVQVEARPGVSVCAGWEEVLGGGGEEVSRSWQGGRRRKGKRRYWGSREGAPRCS